MSEIIVGPAQATEFDAVESLIKAAFPEHDVKSPILGITDDIKIAPDLTALLINSDCTTDVLKEDGRLVGANIVMPTGMMDPTREKEHDTAYIYYTAINPTRQGNGLVKSLSAFTLGRLLNDGGYSYVEQHNVIDYARKVKKAYKSAIVVSEGPKVFFEEVGLQMFFRINLLQAIGASTSGRFGKAKPGQFTTS